MTNINTDYAVRANSYPNMQNSDSYELSNNNVSIFSDTATTDPINTLEEEFEEVQDKQGFLGKLWNGIKNVTGIGLGSNKVEDAIEDYNNGEISYEEALETIESYEEKQEGGVNLITNIAAGAATAGIAVATGGISLGAGGIGAAISGGAKAGLKTADKATNEGKGDAFDIKKKGKEAQKGAVYGAGK